MPGAHTGLTEKVLSYKPIDPPLEEIQPPKDRAFFADPEKKTLLSAATKVKHLTPYIGTELQGIQISKLDDKQKDELALLVAERGVVFFRDQDLTLEGQHEFTKHYGIQDRDPNQVDPRHVTILGRGGDIRSFEHTSSAFAEFHSDHSFELNPPSYTLLRMVKAPEYGGDTLFTSQTALFDKLSPTFQNTLQGLHGVHSSEHVFINTINSGGTTFRLPVRTEHPLVTSLTLSYPTMVKPPLKITLPNNLSQIRTHPITNLKSLFYNPAFTIHIAELAGSEALHVLNFLRDHLHSADDLSVRWHWEAGSVAFWDNRVVAHRAIPGGYNTEEREGRRTAVFGERPFYDPASKVLGGRGFETGDVKLGLDGF
ncbi:hypothetical protein BDW59DRAFT_161238 [Aspergillus cavernicola]|uniref:TauD/TfdA-like domain-containing protein n=1 Tax=Aspergillus cavernicola TaxID=176166 RepID=A0ABR4IES3_9EURO